MGGEKKSERWSESGPGGANGRGAWRGREGSRWGERARRRAQPLQGRPPETGATRAPSGLCWGPALRCILGSIALPRAPSSAVIYGWARPGDLGRINNDGSIPLQKK